jgi:hypothetical protein
MAVIAAATSTTRIIEQLMLDVNPYLMRFVRRQHIDRSDKSIMLELTVKTTKMLMVLVLVLILPDVTVAAVILTS